MSPVPGSDRTVTPSKMNGVVFKHSCYRKLPGKIPVFFIFRSQKLLHLRYWKGRLEKPDIMGKKGNMKVK